MPEDNETSSGGTLNRFEKHKKATFAVFFVLIFIFADFAAARLFITPTAMGPSFYSHHDLAPNYDRTETWGIIYPFFTNNLGFSDAKVRTVPLATDKHRIVFIGDSFTEGLGVPWPLTFVGRISEVLKPKGYDVLNAGVASYSPWLYYNKIKYWMDRGLKFDELVVFVDISDIRDELAYQNFAPTSPFTPKFIARKVNSLLNKNSFIFSSFLNFRIREILVGQSMDDEARALHDAERVLWTIDQDNYEEWGRDGIVLSIKHMDELHKLLEAHNIKLSIAVYPWKENIAMRDLNSKAVSIWQDFASERDLKFYNFFPSFISTSTPVNDVVQKYYIPGDYHWNAEGHAFIAREWLRQYLDN